VYDIDYVVESYKNLVKNNSREIFKYIVLPIQKKYRSYYYGEYSALYSAMEENKKKDKRIAVANIFQKLLETALYRKDKPVLLKTISSFLFFIRTSAHKPGIMNNEYVMLLLKTLTESFREYDELALGNMDEQMEKIFNPDELAKSRISRKGLSHYVRSQLDEEAEELYKKIEASYVTKNQDKLSYYLGLFSGRFCNYPNVKFRNEVDAIIEDITSSDPVFYTKMKHRLATRLYMDIAQAIKSGDIKKAVRGISTYIITFQNDVSIPYRREMDILEESLYKMISKYNLWERVKIT